jgi:hypothetical protein
MPFLPQNAAFERISLIFACLRYADSASLQRNIIAFHSPEHAYFRSESSPGQGGPVY